MIGLSFVDPQYLFLLLLIPLTIALARYGRRALSPLRQWGGLALRCFLLLLIILALAGLQLRLPSNTLTTVFVLDVSDSIPSAEITRGQEFIRAATEKMPTGDQSAIVVFGADSLVERLASPDSALAKISSIPITTRTDIASALQLGMALFPNEGAHRLVLLSDGRENLEFAQKQAQVAALQNIQLEYVPLGLSANNVEVLVDSFTTPAQVRQGQDIDLSLVVQSNAVTTAGLRIFADDALIDSRELKLTVGANRLSLTVRNPQPGFHRYRAQILPDADTQLQNNEGAAFTVVSGPPSVLLVEGGAGEGDALTRALQSAQMGVTVIPPEKLPTTLPELAKYDAVILMNVPAAALPAGAMQALPVYVRELGKGLLMTGGDSSFGAGGYLRSPLEVALPVYMDVKSKELAANLALVVAVDKSGSMGRCHCDNPDLNQSYVAKESGQPKVDIAKEAIMRSAAALGPDDYMGVVAFDSQAHWALDIQQNINPVTLENSISTFSAQGATNMTAGVDAAYQALKGVNAKRKVIILMTDGWVRTGDLTPLIKQMRDQGITLSIVAAGEGSAQYLHALTDISGGSYYPAVDMMSVPDIFLKETIKSIGQYIIEEPFYPLPAGNPGPALRGIDETLLPDLFGYNGTSPKSTARLDLLTPRGDPLFASWQYGLGRSAVWTSDMKGRWATDWLKWKDFSRFSAQLVNWLMPSPQVEGLSPRVSLNDQGAVIHLTAQDASGHPWNDLKVQARLTSPDLKTTDLTLSPTGPGQYEITTRADASGTYLVWLSASANDSPLGQTTLGLVVPYSPEYHAQGVSLGLLDELARITQGGALQDPIQAFAHTLPAISNAREIAQTLLLIVALLFPLDVAIRRVLLTPRDFALARAWVGKRITQLRPNATRKDEPALGQLFSARQRARQQQDRTSAGMPESPTPTQPLQERPTAPDEINQPAPSTDSLERLREAKKRARKG